jgi:hypothetical protein
MISILPSSFLVLVLRLGIEKGGEKLICERLTDEDGGDAAIGWLDHADILRGSQSPCQASHSAGLFL